MKNTLHIVSKPLCYYDAARLTALLTEHDTLLLRGDACYDIAAFVCQAKHSPVVALRPDLVARNMASDVQQIDDTEFVALTLNHRNTLSW